MRKNQNQRHKRHMQRHNPHQWSLPKQNWVKCPFRYPWNWKKNRMRVDCSTKCWNKNLLLRTKINICELNTSMNFIQQTKMQQCIIAHFNQKQIITYSYRFQITSNYITRINHFRNYKKWYFILCICLLKSRLVLLPLKNWLSLKGNETKAYWQPKCNILSVSLLDVFVTKIKDICNDITLMNDPYRNKIG